MSNKPKKYIGEFESKKNKRPFGVRFATAKDAKSISDILFDAYGFEYVNPQVYDEKKIKDLIGHQKTVIWGIAESKDEKKEPAAICVAERKNKFSIHAKKTVVHNKFRGMGLGRGLGVNSLMSILQRPENKDVVRLDSDVRTTQLNSQLMAEAAGSFPYAFIPNYNNFADKRSHDISSGPFTKGRKESVVMYVAPINGFWKKRTNSVVLHDNELILTFYSMIKEYNRKMKKDDVTLHGTVPKTGPSDYTVEEDPYKGTVMIVGYLNQDSINKILGTYEQWNVVEWRIPTTKKGIVSQHLALKNKFILSGYDPGSYPNESGELVDTLVMCIFPNGVELTQFECVELTKSNKFIASKVINQLTQYYPACIEYI